jgi:hypothetical protein
MSSRSGCPICARSCSVWMSCRATQLNIHNDGRAVPPTSHGGPSTQPAAVRGCCHTLIAVQDVDAVHGNPVWGDRADFVIGAPLPEHGHAEQLPARQLSDQRFELCAIPFFLYDIALGESSRQTSITTSRGSSSALAGSSSACGSAKRSIHGKRSQTSSPSLDRCWNGRRPTYSRSTRLTRSARE